MSLVSQSCGNHHIGLLVAFPSISAVVFVGVERVILLIQAYSQEYLLNTDCGKIIW